MTETSQKGSEVVETTVVALDTSVRFPAGEDGEVELPVDGITVATRDCQFLGRFPGAPALSCP